MAGRIVVGVDGSAPSLKALKWAAGQAALTGDTLETVIGWEYPASWATLMPGVPAEFDPEQLAQQILDESLSQALTPEQAAAATRTVIGGNPTQALLDAARGANLLVVGDRGYSGFKAAVLGSVSTHVTQHAPCPVVVVRGGEDD
ncbi:MULTISPECIES: universal stress protein [unclassified Streptomyces]|uniref:universal stress protein n=1 Tax=unclassified Streptomyces TaxID=2593676 RepID=UPI00166120B1|nr:MULTISPECIES: universal stress protein [unclassified Streptomyces]MBD0708985.1 universal stress protein UspA [Streptomyces sp. CBMA291]MBD0716664.1 universal stress protein UspA [Streptomyces sp. CBMA370]